MAEVINDDKPLPFIEDVEFPKLIERSFVDILSFSDRVLYWSKLKFPAIVFSIFMILETIDFASDCAQLATVVNTQQKYFAYPFKTSRTNDYSGNQHSVVWRKINDPNYNTPLLGFDLPWNGNAFHSGKYLWFDGEYCFGNNYYNDENNYKTYSKFIAHIEDNAVKSRSSYQEERVCIAFDDVFKKFDSVYQYDFVCPNNKTAIFDQKSYIHSFSDTLVSDSSGSINVKSSIAVNKPFSNILLYYKDGWEKKTRTYTQCQALQNIYIGTIVIFAFEALIVIGQGINSLIFLLKLNGARNNEQRIQGIIEYPLIGFIMMHLYLTKDEIKYYALIEKRLKENVNVMGRLTGATRVDNLLHTKVKVSSIIYPFWCSRREGFPESVTLGQAIIYPMILPFTSNFYKTFFPADSNVFTYIVGLFLIPVCIGGMIAAFAMNVTFLFTVVLAYGDKLYISRIVSDIPNFAMSLSYILDVEFSATSAFSAAISGFMTAYYLGSMISISISECKQRDEAIVNSSFHEVYGKLSRLQALSLIVLQPTIMLLCYIFWMPMIFFNISWVVDKSKSVEDDKSVADNIQVKYETELVAIKEENDNP